MMTTPPITPPTIAPVRDLVDEGPPDTGAVVADEEEAEVVGVFGVDREVDKDVGKGVDVNVGGVEEVEELVTPKHETSEPPSTIKGNEIAIGPPAT